MNIIGLLALLLLLIHNFQINANQLNPDVFANRKRSLLLENLTTFPPVSLETL